MKKTVGCLRKRLSAAKQYSRSDCLEIVGVPETAGKKVKMVLRQVASVLIFEVKEAMVDAVQRFFKSLAKRQNQEPLLSNSVDAWTWRRCGSDPG